MSIDISNLINNYSIAIQNFEIYRKSLYIARRIKNNNTWRDKIQGYIQNRYNNFKSNTTKMIDSIINRYTQLVDFNQIILPDSIITNENEIKTEVKNYKIDKFVRKSWEIFNNVIIDV